MIFILPDVNPIVTLLVSIFAIILFSILGIVFFRMYSSGKYKKLEYSYKYSKHSGGSWKGFWGRRKFGIYLFLSFVFLILVLAFLVLGVTALGEI